MPCRYELVGSEEQSVFDLPAGEWDWQLQTTEGKTFTLLEHYGKERFAPGGRKRLLLPSIPKGTQYVLILVEKSQRKR